MLLPAFIGAAVFTVLQEQNQLLAAVAGVVTIVFLRMLAAILMEFAEGLNLAGAG